MNHELFQVSSKLVIFNQSRNKVLILRHDTGFSVPGGHLEKGESIEDALKREIKEELGIGCNVELKIAAVQKYQPHSTPGIDKVDLYFVGELDENAAISIDGSGDDITGWEWASVGKVINGDYTEWLAELLKEVLR